MFISVTETHIKKGSRENPCRCPVALAIKEKTNKRKVEVHAADITIGKTVYVSPASVEFFVNAFDAGERVEPFSFNLTNVKK